MNRFVRMFILVFLVQMTIGALLFVFSKTWNERILGIVLLATMPVVFYITRRAIIHASMDAVRLRELSRSLSNKNWELARSNEQLRISSERKNEFISIASHQLRTPLTALTGYLSMILEHSYGQIPIELNMPITRAHKSAVRLTNLVNELLRISRIEQGDLAYDITPIDTVHLVHEVVDEFSQKATEKNLHLFIDVQPSETPYLALADEQKLREVLHNIVDNAINYTPQGKVTICIKNSDNNTQLIEVSDTGIGIAHEDIRLLFGKFQRGERGARQFTDGSGLGLYISKKLISGMHGQIHIDSPGPGKGAIFTIELPKEGCMTLVKPETPSQTEFLEI